MSSSKTPPRSSRTGTALTNGSSPRKKTSVIQANGTSGGTTVRAFLQNPEASLRALIEHTKEALILFDHEAHVLVFNHAAQELYKIHNNVELKTGISIYDLVPEDRHEPTRRIFE